MSDQPISPEIEALARLWLASDRHEGRDDPDEIMGQGAHFGSNIPTTYYDTPTTGKPRWHRFIWRAEASLEHLKTHGYMVVGQP